jgi:hypothetical protein
MALKPLPGFRPLKTHHCITGSLRHIYVYNDHPLSEEMLLGLGAGVGFVYWHMKGQIPFLGGRANTGRPGEEGLEKTAGRRSGVRVEAFRTGNGKKAEHEMLAILDSGQPVMLQVDMGYLPYFHFPQDYHFGGHAIVVAGYDAEARQTLIADRDGVLHEVSMADLARARGSKHKPFPSEHAWYSFDFREKRLPRQDEIRQAISEAANGMLHPPISNLGVRGIAKSAERVPQWPQAMDTAQVRASCFNSYIMIDAAGGTGGGLFRYMYSRFLREVGMAEECAEAFQLIGDRWQVAAGIFKTASETEQAAEALPEIGARLRELSELEGAAWAQLAALNVGS